MPTPIPLESFPLLMDLINQTYLDRVEQITAAQVNDDDSIVFVGLDNPKKIAGKITDDHISMKLMGTSEKPQFAAPKKKPKNCSSPTSISCGLTCLPAKTKAGKDTVCKKPISPNQKAQKKSIVETAKKSKQPKGDRKEATAQKDSAAVNSADTSQESALERVRKTNPELTDFNATERAKQVDKLETRLQSDDPSEADRAYRDALLSKIDPHSSEAALDRVNSLYRARNELEKKGRLSDDRLRDIPHDFGQGFRSQVANLAAAEYTAEIWDKLSDSHKDKFVEHWKEYSSGSTISKQLGKRSGYNAVLKSKKVKAFIEEIDRRVTSDA